MAEYVRELSAIETFRDSAEQVLKQGGKVSNAVYMSTRMQLELRAQIAVVRRMRLNPPFEELISNLTAFYARKIELYQRLSDVTVDRVRRHLIEGFS